MTREASSLLCPLDILAPAFREASVYVEEVERPSNRLIYHFLDTFRTRVKHSEIVVVTL